MNAVPSTSTVTLAGDRVVLRPFAPSDAEARAQLGQDASIVRMFGGSPDWSGRRSMAIEDAREWFDFVANDGNPWHWAVEVDGRFVGTARLHDLSAEDARVRYAVGILDATLLGKGLGRDITLRVLRYAFEDLHLHRVDPRVLAYNTRAIRCYRGCGFVEEGREREAALVDGHWHDDVIMGILAREFAS